MAITRAQQFKQMLQDGGRIGFQGGGKDLGAGATGMGSGQRRGSTKGVGGQSPKRGPNNTVQAGGAGEDRPPSYTPPSDDEIRRIFKLEDDREIGETKQAYKQRTAKGVRGVISNFRNKRFQNAINRNKVLALRELGLMDPKSFNLYGALFQGFEEVPDYFKDLDEDELLGIATSGPYLSQQKTKGDVAEFSQGKDLLGRVFEAQDLLDQNKLTQDKFQELFPGPPKAKDEGSPQIVDPCKGPNPPAYCFIGKNAETTTADPSSVFAQFGITPRIAGSQFAADGGRIGYDDGGMLVSPSKDGKRPGYRRSKYDSTGGGLASSSKASDISPGPGDDDSPQQTTTRPSGGIPAADIFKEATRRANFQLIDPIQQNRFAQVLKMKKLIEESGLEEPETTTDAIGSGATVGPVDLTPEKLKEIRKEADLGSLFGGPSEFAQDKFIERVQDKKYGNPDLNQPGLDAPDILKSIKESDEKAGTDLFKGFDLEDVKNVMPLVQADQLPRALVAEGGIMDLGRQELFLGGIAKGLKKAARGVSRALKKVAKSPIGKAALVGALGYGLGGGTFFGKMLPGVTRGGQGIGGFGGLDAIFGNVGDMIGGKTLGDAFAKFGGSKLGLGATLVSILPLLAGKTEEEKKNILDEYLASQKLNPSLSIRGMGGDTNFDFYGARTQAVADGGRIGYQEGSKEPVAKKTMPLLDMDGQEMDLRDNGGFVPIGRMEKADDVPARLSKNEFVFTADAVRNAGDGDVDKGAEVMYNMMKNLERGGNVSDESQGLEGARRMFQTSKRLEEVL